ncbi:hypothetical protein FACS189461_0890 [Spirochaetia bacterium]|nr:hypothetical protein FACS189461_0890 [Spirochaetia bacterium]
MTGEERAFLNALILRNKPKKLLEIGVSAGSSSIVMLNAIKDSPDAILHSIDYLDHWYRSSDKKVGYFVDNYMELKKQWRLYYGGLSLKFMDEIVRGEGVDFCLIDTAHVNPGEILDFLMILPYLKEDATVVFHDVNLHTWNYPYMQWSITNNLLISAITGQKYLQGNFSPEGIYENIQGSPCFPNIAAVKINENTKKHVFEVFNLLTIKWGYLPSGNEQMEIISHFGKHYDAYYINYLRDIFAYQKKCHDKEMMLFWYRLKNFLKEFIGKKK